MSALLRPMILAVSLLTLTLLGCSSSQHTGASPNADSTSSATIEPPILDTLRDVDTAKTAVVQTGLDRLIAENFRTLAGKRVGMITNQTSRTKSGEFGPHVLAHQNVFKLVALYGPEHGITGARAAGVTSDTMERFEGIPVYSLYGSTRKPTKQMLAGVNALLFDIQDVGVRPYTFLSTMILGMEAAAENGIPFYVLDRPNPLSGDRVEGNVLDPSLKSFVGQVPVPYLHGMTLGELAQMAKAKSWFNSASALDLHVITMSGWKRSMYWPQTSLQWIAPSPNVPTFASAVGLAMFGATGELGVLSVGIGTDAPFLKLGSNILPDSALVRAARRFLPFPVVAEHYTAITNSTGEKSYDGIRVLLPGADAALARSLASAASLYMPQYSILTMLEANATFANALRALPQSTHLMYDKVTGEHNMLNAVLSGHVTSQLPEWKREAEAFKRDRAPYLLY